MKQSDPTRSEVYFSGADGQQVRMILSKPVGAGPHPALVLLPDVRGIYDHFLDVADRFAAEGYLTATLDLYSREGAPEIVDVTGALEWMAQLADRRVLSDIEGCVRALGNTPEIRSDAIAITGFCMGGQYALMSACKIEGLAACISWYGMLRHALSTQQKLADPLDEIGDLLCPYLGFFGAKDELIPQTQVDELRAALRDVARDSEVIVYPEAGHAFFNDSRPPGYDAEAASDAWPRALAFLNRHLE